MECESARATGVRADAARKTALLQSDVETTQRACSSKDGDSSSGRLCCRPSHNGSSKGSDSSVAQRIDDSEIAKGSVFPSRRTLATWPTLCLQSEIETLCPLPAVIERGSARGTFGEEMPTPLTSSGGLGVSLHSMVCASFRLGHHLTRSDATYDRRNGGKEASNEDSWLFTRGV